MKKKFNLTSVGGSSILTIFGVLMLIVFALLSLSTAKADRNLADRTWQAKEAYYKADREAEEINQQLQVVVEISGKDYRIKQWKKVYTGDWQGDNSIEVFGGVQIDD